MKTFVNFILFVTVSCLLFSCQKELSIDSSLPSDNNGNNNGNNSGNTSIIGDWSFIGADMDVSSTGKATDDMMGNIEITTSYKTTTINNKGSLKITATDIISTDFSYSISANAKMQTFIGGILTSTQELPFEVDVPTSSSSGKYQQIGNDSLYLPNGALISVPDGISNIPSTTTSEPSGAKFSIASDTLRFFGGMNQTSNQNYQGQTISVTQKALVILKYKRK